MSPHRGTARIGALALVAAALAVALPTGARPSAAEPVPVVGRADLGPLPVYDEFVDQQYRDLQGRPPTSAERDALVTGFRSRTLSAEDVFGDLQPTGSAVERQASVTRLYHAFFGRLPDKSGLAHWERRRATGTTVAQAAAAFASGSEFVRTYGHLSNAAYIDRVYRNVLLRAPDPAGLAFWVGRMNRGVGRGTVMAGFSESAEHQRRTATASTLVLASTRMLGRPPSAAELDAAAALAPAPGFAAIAAAILRGAPYRALHPEQASSTLQQNARHDGVATGDLRDGLTERWTVRLPYAVQRPVVAGGRVFVVEGPVAGSAQLANLRALDIDDGSVLWGPVALPNSTYGTVELAYGDGTVFAMNHSAELRAIDAATGTVRWTTTPPGQTSAGRALTYADGVLYGTSYGNGATLTFAVSAADGTVRWTAPVGGTSSPPVVDGDAVYVGGPGGNAYALDRATGARRWTRDTGNRGDSGDPLVLHDGKLYLRSSLNAAVLHAATGDVLAPYTSTANSMPSFWGSDRVERVRYDPASSYGPVQVVDRATGTVRWSSDGDDPTSRAGYQAHPVVVGGDVFVATRYGVVDRYRISDGTRTWRATVPMGDDEYEPGAINSLSIGNGLLLAQTQRQITAYG